MAKPSNIWYFGSLDRYVNPVIARGHPEDRTMPRKKAAPTENGFSETVPDRRSQDRRSIDRARSYLNRLRKLGRVGIGQLEDAVELAESKHPMAEPYDQTALEALRSEAAKLNRYLPAVVAMIDALATSGPGAVKLTDPAA